MFTFEINDYKEVRNECKRVFSETTTMALLMSIDELFKIGKESYQLFIGSDKMQLLTQSAFAFKVLAAEACAAMSKEADFGEDVIHRLITGNERELLEKVEKLDSRIKAIQGWIKFWNIPASRTVSLLGIYSRKEDV